MRHRVILFNPPLYYSNGHPQALDTSVPPLGLLYLASYINHYSSNFEALVCDIGSGCLDLFSVFSMIKEAKPIAIGLCAMTPQLQGCLELARTIRTEYPGVRIFIGGPHVSADADFIHRFPDLFDYAITGEAEKTFLDSLEKLRNDKTIPKIQHSDLINDLDLIPFPDRKLVNRSRYNRRESMIFSRGCPYKCYYCSRPAISTKVRYRSADNLLDEIRSVYEYCGGKIDFQDDTFTLDKPRVMEFCEKVRPSGFKLDWHCNTRIDLVDEEILLAMGAAGCTLIHFGIESGSEVLRREIILKGGFSNKKIREVFKICHRAGIKVGAYFMIGHPGETFQDIAETKNFILNSGIDLLGVAIPTPFPGSRLYDIAVSQGLISTEIVDRFAQKKLGEGYMGNYPVYINKDHSAKEVFELRKEIIRKFYLRPTIILHFLKENIGSFAGLRKILIDGLCVVFEGSSKRQPYCCRDDKAVIVTPFFVPNIGGLETHLKYYTDFLAAKNVPAVVLTYKPLTGSRKGWKRRERNNSVEIYRYWWWGQLFEKFSARPALEFVYMVPKLFFNVLSYSITNRKNIRVFHAHGLIAAFIVRIVNIFIIRRKIVSTHYIYNLQARPFFTKVFLWVFNGFDKVLAVGEESRRELMSAGYPKEKIELFNHSIDNETIFTIRDKGQIRKKYLFKDSDLIVLFVGRLLAMKGIKKIVGVASANPDIKFIFVGAGELSGYIKNSAANYPNTLYMGKKFGEELVEIYNLSDMVILPSTEEGASLVVIEALSCGKPVIVTNKGCSKDMFPDDLGEKIDPTEENIIRAIRKIQKKDLDLLAQRCRFFALKTYGSANLQKILDISLEDS